MLLIKQAGRDRRRLSGMDDRAEVNPAMAELRDLARAQLAESHEAARRGARSVTLRLTSAA